MTESHPLRPRVEALWERRDTLGSSSESAAHAVVREVLEALGDGSLRVAAPVEGANAPSPAGSCTSG